MKSRPLSRNVLFDMKLSCVLRCAVKALASKRPPGRLQEAFLKESGLQEAFRSLLTPESDDCVEDWAVRASVKSSGPASKLRPSHGGGARTLDPRAYMIEGPGAPSPPHGMISI